MAKNKKECCYNCQHYSRTWKFCGNPESHANKSAELVGAYEWCLYWEARYDA